MKIDLRKAYDMVIWKIIEEILDGYGFPRKFVQLIMKCVTTTKFSVKVNGEGHGYFEGIRTLDKGIPSLLCYLCWLWNFSRTRSTS